MVVYTGMISFANLGGTMTFAVVFLLLANLPVLALAATLYVARNRFTVALTRLAIAFVVAYITLVPISGGETREWIYGSAPLIFWAICILNSLLVFGIWLCTPDPADQAEARRSGR
jgi:hypothetical protein